MWTIFEANKNWKYGYQNLFGHPTWQNRLLCSWIYLGFSEAFIFEQEMKSPYSCPSTVKQTLQRKRQQTTPVNAKYSITAISETALPCPVQQYNAILPGNIYHTTTWCKTTSTSIHVPLWNPILQLLCLARFCRGTKESLASQRLEQKMSTSEIDYF